ncbi:MAG: hypothetical protein ACPIOQ_77140, partial [Promethearchaeia archaeon]
WCFCASGKSPPRPDVNCRCLTPIASSAEAVSAGLRSLRLSPGAGDGKGAGGEEEKAREGKGTGVAGKAGEVGVVARPVVSVQSVADGGQERSGVTRDGKPSTERGSG